MTHCSCHTVTNYGRVQMGERFSLFYERSVETNSVLRVNSIQEDKFNSKKIILAYGSALHLTRTNYKNRSTILAGNPYTSGLRNDHSLKSLFSEIADFAQIFNSKILISDKDNQCIRLLNRNTSRVSTYQCSKNMSVYTPWLTFNQPTTIQFDEINNIVYLLDHVLSESVVVGKNLYTGTAFITYVHPLRSLIINDFLYVSKTGDFIISENTAIMNVTTTSKNILIQDFNVSHGLTPPQIIVGALTLYGDILLNTKIKDGGGFIELVNIQQRGPQINDNNYCCFNNPTALAVVNKYLYVGTSTKSQVKIYRGSFISRQTGLLCAVCNFFFDINFVYRHPKQFAVTHNLAQNPRTKNSKIVNGTINKKNLYFFKFLIIVCEHHLFANLEFTT